MGTTQDIDVRGLEHSAREGIVFPGIEELGPGEEVRFLFEFDPVPLVHLLRARGGFEPSTVRRDSSTWVLTVKRAQGKPEEAKEDRGGKEEIKRLLAEMRQGSLSPEAREKAEKFLRTVDPATLGYLEQELIREGVSHEEIRKSLCEVHLDMMRESLAANRVEPPESHPVRTFMEEHKIILENLGGLAEVLAGLEGARSLEAMGDDLGKLQAIASNLVEAERHHTREEEALFPRLESHDVHEPPSIMRMDHVEFRERKSDLFAITRNPQSRGFEEFRSTVVSHGAYLVKELEGHIFKEDNILYQIALQVLSPQEWDEVKRDCDKIGYCCFSPVGAGASTHGDGACAGEV